VLLPRVYNARRVGGLRWHCSAAHARAVAVSRRSSGVRCTLDISRRAQIVGNYAYYRTPGGQGGPPSEEHGCWRDCGRRVWSAPNRTSAAARTRGHDQDDVSREGVRVARIFPRQAGRCCAVSAGRGEERGVWCCVVGCGPPCLYLVASCGGCASRLPVAPPRSIRQVEGWKAVMTPSAAATSPAP